MLLYVPITVTASNKLPVFTWFVLHFQCYSSLIVQRIHGGSFISGSATAPGLDGTIFANATSAIVVVVQYRLGPVS